MKKRDGKSDCPHDSLIRLDGGFNFDPTQKKNKELLCVCLVSLLFADVVLFVRGCFVSNLRLSLKCSLKLDQINMQMLLSSLQSFN
jgi:hypothetical protein